jgi:putative addiction module CopG family antidote
MEIALVPELEQFIHQQVALGRFSTLDDAVNAAIQRYEAIEQLYQGRDESLRAEIQIGLDAAD